MKLLRYDRMSILLLSACQMVTAFRNYAFTQITEQKERTFSAPAHHHNAEVFVVFVVIMKILPLMCLPNFIF